MNTKVGHIAIITISFWYCIATLSFAQDVQFSQFYAAPTYLNPAFAGNTINARLAGNYRNQWTSFNGNFVSYTMAYDQNLAHQNSGFGFLLVKDKAGSVDLNYTQLTGNYAYNIYIHRKLAMRLGMGLSYASRSIDQSKFVFASQITNDSQGAIPYTFNNANYFDVSSGAIIYGWDWWAGVSVNHLFEPNQTTTGGLYQLPRELSFHSGYTIALTKNIKKKVTSTITPIVHYKLSQQWDQLDLGMYLTKEPLVFGVWYRGLPFVKYNPDKININRYVNQDAVVLLFGFDFSDLKIGYSYDITVSQLSGNTNGSHEISLRYEIASRQQKLSYRRRFLVPCAKF